MLIPGVEQLLLSIFTPDTTAVLCVSCRFCVLSPQFAFPLDCVRMNPHFGEPLHTESIRVLCAPCRVVAALLTITLEYEY